MIQRILLTLMFGFFSFSIYAQDTPIGGWSVHYAYKNGKTISKAGDKVYVAGNGGMFSYDQRDGSMERISKVSGLSDVDISLLKYDKNSKSLLVAYSNANIDLLFNNRIINMPELLKANVLGNKNINNVRFIGSRAYLSCGFGIVELDMIKREVRDTWYIGANGSALEIFDLDSDGTYFYVAAKDGIYRAPANSPNLSSFNSWTKLNPPAGQYNFLTFFQGKVYANRKDAGGQDEVFTYDGNSWTLFNPGFTYLTEQLDRFNDQLVLVNNFSVNVYDQSATRVIYLDGNTYSDPAPKKVFIDEEYKIWIADERQGLVRYANGVATPKIFPNGPDRNMAFAMEYSDGRIWVAPGGRTLATANLYIQPGIYKYFNNTWTHIKGGKLDTIYDIFNVAVDPLDPDHAFFGAWGRGLIEVKGTSVVQYYNEMNSTLAPISAFYWLGVGGIAFDAAANLWVSNSGVAAPLSVRKSDGVWQSFSFPGLVNSSNNIMGSVLVDKANQKWVILSKGGGILVFSENGTLSNTSDDKVKVLTDGSGKGNLPSKVVYCMVEDKDGEIWVGTEKGIAVFFAPGGVFSNSPDAQQILIQQDGYNQYLLESETVTAIAIDGANRKWIGTVNAGLFLMSADGTKEIAHFKASNSPLPADEIQSITIHEETGEVFIGTTAGIVSLRGEAIEGGEKCKDVYAFPNPARETYRGPIAIKGVMADANIKITDVAGNLVYETTALGGQAIWNGNNFLGERVQTGVYLIFASNKDGSQTCTTKLLLVN